jgi:hypothetical protein
MTSPHSPMGRVGDAIALASDPEAGTLDHALDPNAGPDPIAYGFSVAAFGRARTPSGSLRRLVPAGRTG